MKKGNSTIHFWFVTKFIMKEISNDGEEHGLKNSRKLLVKIKYTDVRNKGELEFKINNCGQKG